MDGGIADSSLSKHFDGWECTMGELLEGLRFEMSGWGVTHGWGRSWLMCHGEIDRVWRADRRDGGMACCAERARERKRMGI